MISWSSPFDFHRDQRWNSRRGVNFQFRSIFYLREGNSGYNGETVEKQRESSLPVDTHERERIYLHLRGVEISITFDEKWLEPREERASEPTVNGAINEGT